MTVTCVVKNSNNTSGRLKKEENREIGVVRLLTLIRDFFVCAMF